MKRVLAFAAIMSLSLSMSLPVLAEDTTEWPFGIAPEEVTDYTRPDHVYTSLEGYSDNVVYDLPYCGEGSTEYQKLHLVLPAEENTQDGKLPLLVFVHGGGWSGLNSVDHTVGYTAEGALWALQRGYAVALVDYSIMDETNTHAMPDQIYEVKAAIRYLRSIAEEYNFDTEKIAVMGESAGGHLVNMIGTTIGETQYDKEELGNIEFSSDVQAVVFCCADKRRFG